MTESVVGSTIPRRILGVALRQARMRAGKTQVDAAEAIDQSEQTVRRIEQGSVPTPAGKVDNLCRLYGSPTQTREALKALARETKSTAQRWWHSYGDVVPNWFEVYVALEQMASRERVFDPLLVNGLLQADGYMGQAIRAIDPAQSDEEVAVGAELRRSRQQLLTRPFPAPLRLDTTVAEPVLLVELPDGLMRAQLWKLLKATELPNVSLRVLPLSAGLHRASVTGAFTLLDFPDEGGSAAAPTTIYSESQTGAIYSEAPSEVELYESAWAALEDAALDQTPSVELMSRLLKELVDRGS
ncbi:helix-turn-helix transcriptional regulator [Actinoplanes sp. NPDC051411]|uniref:helix-turn-helix domain-containing protein n=1 Tax=Actinoplanes sp. NPDC051411 TaxID=3155522 RepID=UPI0034278D15